MGKPSPNCVHLPKMSSSSASKAEGGSATTPSPVVVSKKAIKLEPIPKLYIRKTKDLVEHGKRKMSNEIMQRLSISRESTVYEAKKSRIEHATKVFRRRSSSSTNEDIENNLKLHVIDSSYSVPGMLQTPTVQGSPIGMNVFKSDACDSVLRKYKAAPSSSSVHSSPTTSISMSEIEADAMVTSPASTSRDAFPGPSERPKIKTPPINEFFKKPRTVAEKRMILRQSPVEYKILDFENSVYHLIKKMERFRDDVTFQTQVELLMYSTVPTNRNIWKALLWLNAEVGGYQPWHVTIDGQRLRLLGATGTLVLDDLEPVITTGLYVNRRYQPSQNLSWCCDNRVKLRKLRNEPELLKLLDRKETLEEEKASGSHQRTTTITTPPSPKKLISKRTADLAKLPPGPLSVKVRRLERIKRPKSHMGPLELYDLPMETITAVPEVNKRQSKRICSYLKLAVPDDEMTTEWLDFSLSVLQPPNSDAAQKVQQEFKFPIPYKNNQRRILVRRITSRKRGELRAENYEEQMKYTLTFPEVAKAQCKDGDDDLNDDVEHLLRDMIDSVAMSFSEDYFVRDDPDQTYQTEPALKPLSLGNETASHGGVRVKKNRATDHSALRREMLRLNVTIIDTAKLRVTGACSREECRQGCVCDSISELDGISKHCTKVECIFGCHCSGMEHVDEDQQRLLRMRDEKIGRLARAEKEYTSTMVLTNSDTILMRNSEDTKRNRRKTKRYYDYLESNDTESEQKEAEAAANGKKLGTWWQPAIKPKRERWHPELEKMRHCAVVLPQIPQLEVLEPWCMVHELYRCFCENQRIEGRPFKLHTAPDGTIRANVKETLLLNRRRGVTFAKDESQDSLERMPQSLRLLPEEIPCSRCTPTDFTDQKARNIMNAPQVQTKVSLAQRKYKQARLEVLVENCLNAVAMSQQGTSRQAQMNEQVQMNKRQQFLEDAGNELGLKITSIRSLVANGAPQEFEGQSSLPDMQSEVSHNDVAPAPGMTPEAFEGQLSVLKQQLLMKLNSILESCARTLLQPAHVKKVSFVRYRDFKTLMSKMSLVEVWKNDVPDMIVLGRDLATLQVHFKDHKLVSVLHPDRKFYLSRFLTDTSPNLQSQHIYIVTVGSGKNYWHVRGCQYIKDPQAKVRISSDHTSRLREYATQSLQRPNRPKAISNLIVMELNTSGNEKVMARLPTVENQRFLMINVESDFSDMAHPNWKGLLSYNFIRQATAMANKEGKTIKVIRGPSTLRPNVYATPKYPSRVFAGPFAKDELSRLTLYQRLDNSLFLREEYEQMLNIKRQKHTIGIWLANDQLNGDDAVDESCVVHGQRRLSSSAAGQFGAVVKAAEGRQSVSREPTVLPELEIISIDKAAPKAIATNSAQKLSPVPIVSITPKPPSTDRPSASVVVSSNSRSLLKPINLRPVSVADLKTQAGPPPLAPITPFTNLSDALKNPKLQTFCVGNTIVKRQESSSSDKAVAGPSSVPDLPSSAEDAYSSEDDDVVLVEDPGDSHIIDLDEWERVQHEYSDDDEPMPEAAEDSTHKLSDGDEEAAAGEEGEKAVSGEPTRIPSTFKDSIPLSGYYRSNIPSLGNIPAKILNGVITLKLPIRKMPIKIGVNCVDRYMWRYIQNTISACFPRDLEVKWEFVNSYFPTKDTLFTLEPTPARHHCVLTKYGVIDVMRDDKTEEDIPDTLVYLKYLASRLCLVVFRKLGVYSAVDIIEETLKVIKQERYQILKNNREISLLTTKKVDLEFRLNKLKGNNSNS